MSRSRAKGTSWESKIVEFLQASGWPHAERRALQGAKDKGDISGLPGVCIEAKNEKAITLATYIKEVEEEKINSGATVAFAWIKRRGKASAADGYVVMTGQQAVELLKAAGW